MNASAPARPLPASGLLWAVILGLALAYVPFFITPLFLTETVMQFPAYEPAAGVTGVDFRSTRAAAAAWSAHSETPYINNNQYAYPPLTLALFWPTTRISGDLGYRLITFVNVACALLVGLVLPWRLAGGRAFSPLLTVAALTGLFSYGFQFELERGQHNLIAFTLALTAVWLYHRHPRWRYAGYALFIAAVQLKVYPVLLAPLLIDDWRAWRRNVRRIVGLGVINMVLLGVFGPNLLYDFLRALADASANPYAWQGNHSIRAFTLWYPHVPGWDQIAAASGALAVAAFAVVALCVGGLMLQAYGQARRGFQPLLFLACTLAALMLPGSSHDYTLSYLVAPVAVLFAWPDLWTAPARWRQVALVALLIAFCAAYGSTLASYATKPLQLHNNLPALLIMLLVGTAVAFLTPPPAQLRAGLTPNP